MVSACLPKCHFAQAVWSVWRSDATVCFTSRQNNERLLVHTTRGVSRYRVLSMKFHIANITHELYLHFYSQYFIAAITRGESLRYLWSPPVGRKNKTKNEWITRVSRNKRTHAEKQTTGLEGIQSATLLARERAVAGFPLVSHPNCPNQALSSKSIMPWKALIWDNLSCKIWWWEKKHVRAKREEAPKTILFALIQCCAVCLLNRFLISSDNRKIVRISAVPSASPVRFFGATICASQAAPEATVWRGLR